MKLFINIYEIITKFFMRFLVSSVLSDFERNSLFLGGLRTTNKIHRGKETLGLR